MQGLRVDLAEAGHDRALIERALDDAFDYRGDVSLSLADGSTVEGFVFDRRRGDSLETSFVRLLPRDAAEKRSISWAQIRTVTFSDKDPAAGKTWENWVRRYAQKKLQGEAASIESEPLE